jgi:hypothetical protein
VDNTRLEKAIRSCHATEMKLPSQVHTIPLGRSSGQKGLTNAED